MILDLVQGSEKWLEVRKYCVSATDASSIMHRAGLIKYPYAKAKVETHIKHKIEPSKGNKFMQKGIEYEPLIMQKLQKENPTLDNLIIQVNNNMASFDAVDVFSGIIREIKTSSTTLDKIKLLIPGYVCQVAHQAYILYDELEQSIPLEQLDCKIILLQFYMEDGVELTKWHVTNIDITNDNVKYSCKTLDIEDTIDLSVCHWRELCDNFYLDLMNYHNTNNILKE